ncbi:MAG: carboxypeptidase-like regulatory domain-containing protein [Flavobacteriales bacterium]|nr:carboxypeptidase-like regulatory domain-containing protein [Flavobacteriales bacterium]
MTPINESWGFAFECSENWNSMQGDQFSRHCTKCAHSVFNLDGLSDPEIDSLVIANNGKLCGRRTISQKRRISRWSRAKQIVLCFVLILFIQVRKVMAQSGFTDKGEPSGSGSNELKFNKLHGVIVDEEDQTPLGFATVELLTAEQRVVGGTYTDEQGSFDLAIPDSLGVKHLRIRYAGYAVKLIPIDTFGQRNIAVRKTEIVSFRCKSEVIIVGALIHRPLDVRIHTGIADPRSIGTTKTYTSSEIERYNLGR